MEVIEFQSVIRFLMQLSVVVLGAATLWGSVFFFKAGKKESSGITKSAARGGGVSEWKDLGMRATIVSFLSLISFTVFWSAFYFFVYAPEALGHEGIVIPSTTDILERGFSFNTPFAFLIFIIGALSIFLFLRKKRVFEKYAKWLLGAQFILASIILCFASFTGDFFSREQIFFAFHNWHSIMTLGTVIMVDMLYISTLFRLDLKKVLYPFFPIMSAAIWIGLAFDFASVALVFEEAFQVTTQLLFNQTVIGIIIINGALLSGKINNLLVESVKGFKQEAFSHRTSLILGVSGSVSIVSWLTITFLDFFHLPFSYAVFFIGYLAIIAIAFLTQHILEHSFLPKIYGQKRKEI